jgi:hypothetical protein
MKGLIPNLSREELENLYYAILDKLTLPFPPGTVEFKNNNKASAYIPSHAIQNRIRSVAGPYWSWRISTDKPIYHEETDEIEVRGVLTILHASAEGQGFAKLDRYEDSKKIKFYKEAVRAAASDAFRDAADYFGIGHHDLAPYRKWAENPGVGLINDAKMQSLGSTASGDLGKRLTVEHCKKCGVLLTQEDIEYLKLVNWTIKVCKEHVPEHQKRKYDPNYVPGG